MADKIPTTETTTPEVVDIAKAVELAVAKALENLDSTISEKVNAAVELAVADLKLTSVDTPVEAKPITPFSQLNLVVGKRKFGFNLPSISLPNSKGGYQVYTADEVCDKENTELATKLVEMYDAEETRFIKEL